MNWGIVFIDCWNWPKHEQFYKRAVEELNKLTIVSKVCCSTGDQLLDPIITEMFDNDTIHLNSPSEFLEQQHNTNSWIIVGAAWNICTHYGPMGVEKLVYLDEHNFHIFPKWSILTELQEYITACDIIKDKFYWRMILPDCYKLEGFK